ncbi:MAG: RDD family protein [Gammaproteobacteria bacterium]|nr:RDD family protein [Gammaproteobacteria bacterium]
MDAYNLDSLNAVQTPEGIEINLRLAGIWPRSVAWMIDTIIRGVIYFVLALVVNQFGKFGTGLLLISIFIMEWFYPVLFEVLNNGVTPGKKSLGLQVVNADGTPIGWSSSMLRNILRTVDFLPLFYGVGLISMLMNDKFQRLGDLAADTLVVYRQQNTSESQIPEAPALHLPPGLNLKEQQAIITFAERSSQLSEERKEELAGILSQLKPAGGSMTADELIRLANGLAGR